jgi:protein ImuA
MNDALEELLRHPALWRGGDAGAPETVPTGFRALDARLPGVGWPLATLIELLVPAAGVGEIRLLAGTAALTTAGRRTRWVARLPAAPAVCTRPRKRRTDPHACWWSRPRRVRPVWAMEQAL